MATDHRPLWVLRGLLALATLILAGGPATAAALTRATLPLFSLGCAELPGVSGSATLFADQQGPDLFASAAVWTPGTSPDGDPPALVSAGSTLHRAGDTITGTLEMVDAVTGESAGEARFVAVLRPVGDPTVSDSRPTRDGNMVDRGYRSEQDAAADGALVLPDGSERSISSCTATVGQIVVIRNTPSRIVEHEAAQTIAECLVRRVDDHVLDLLLLSEDGETFAEVKVFAPGSQDPAFFGSGPVALDRRTLVAALPLIDVDGYPAGEATVAATVDRLGPRVAKGREGDVDFKVFFRDLELRGTVVVSAVGSFPLDGACTAFHQRGTIRYPNPEA